MRETDTSNLQMLAKIMELETAFTLRLILRDLPPNSIKHTDLELDLIEGSGLTRAQLVFINIHSRENEMAPAETFQALVNGDGSVVDDDTLVQEMSKSIESFGPSD